MGKFGYRTLPPPTKRIGRKKIIKVQFIFVIPLVALETLPTSSLIRSWRWKRRVTLRYNVSDKTPRQYCWTTCRNWKKMHISNAHKAMGLLWSGRKIVWYIICKSNVKLENYSFQHVMLACMSANCAFVCKGYADYVEKFPASWKDELDDCIRKSALVLHHWERTDKDISFAKIIAKGRNTDNCGLDN